MENTSKFQIILLIVFGAFIVIGVLIFALYRGGGSGREKTGSVTVWGTFSAADFNSISLRAGLDKDDTLDLTYVQKSEANFDSDFVDALAEGRGPDLILASHERILKNEKKLTLIPYQSYPERTFKDTFLEEGDLFARSGGIVALPLVVDPLVMYWNRTLFSNAGLALPPETWVQFFSLSTSLTKKDPARNISQSAIAFGEYGNINHAKEILSTLIMQAGSPIVARAGDRFSSVLDTVFDPPINPGEEALNFYAEFSNPIKSFYSWNRSLPRSLNFFLSGDLAVYFGFASELFAIQEKNPNLNFDVVLLPQSLDSPRKTTFGRLYVIAPVKNSLNSAGAFKVANVLTGREGVLAAADILKLPPARRDLLALRQTDAYLAVFYNSAIRAEGWHDPDTSATNRIFQNMIESVTSGQMKTSQSLQRASSELQQLLK